MTEAAEAPAPASMAQILARARSEASVAAACYQATQDGRLHHVLLQAKAAYIETALRTFQVMQQGRLPMPDGHIALVGTLIGHANVEAINAHARLARMSAAAMLPADVQAVADYPVRLLGALQGFQDLQEASDLPPSPYAPIPRK